MTIFDTLYNERRIYETPDTPRDVWHARLTSAQAGQLLNRVAWQHRSEGIGLLAKTTGNRAVQPVTGLPIAADILTNNRTGHHFDVLIDGPDISVNYAGTAIPSFSDKGLFDISRFVVPVEPPEIHVPPVPPEPLAPASPPPPEPAPFPPDLDALLQRLDALRAALVALQGTSVSTDRHVRDLAAALAELQVETAKGLDGTIPFLGTVKLRPPKA